MERAHTEMTPVELPGYRLLEENYVVQYAIDPSTGVTMLNADTSEPVIQLLERTPIDAIP